MSDREEFTEARAAGLKARHETREARAIRKAVAEEIAQAIEKRRLARRHRWFRSRRWSAEQESAWSSGMFQAAGIAHRYAREIGSKEAGPMEDLLKAEATRPRTYPTGGHS